jgi:hypothetical protein
MAYSVTVVVTKAILHAIVLRTRVRVKVVARRLEERRLGERREVENERGSGSLAKAGWQTGHRRTECKSALNSVEEVPRRQKSREVFGAFAVKHTGKDRVKLTVASNRLSAVMGEERMTISHSVPLLTRSMLLPTTRQSAVK